MLRLEFVLATVSQDLRLSDVCGSASAHLAHSRNSSLGWWCSEFANRMPHGRLASLREPKTRTQQHFCSCRCAPARDMIARVRYGESMSSPIPARDLADHMIATGELTATTERVAELLGVKPYRVSAALAVARDDGSMVSVTRGLYGAVHNRWRRMRTQPPADYLDALMGHLGHGYYLAYRCAAKAYGVGHRPPFFLQVAVDAHCQDRRIGDAVVRFYKNRRVGKVPTARRRYGDYEVTASIPEVTVFDLVERLTTAGGGIAEVGNNLGDFQTPQQLDADILIEVSELFPCYVVQRTGHILESMSRDLGTFVKEPLDLDLLAESVHRRGARLQDLATPGELIDWAGPGVPVNDRWKIRMNRDIDHDLVGKSKQGMF